MLDRELMISRLKELPIDELVSMIRDSLDEAGVPYEKGYGRIIYDGLDSNGYAYMNSFNVTFNSTVSSFDSGDYHKDLEANVKYAFDSAGIYSSALTGVVSMDATVAA